MGARKWSNDRIEQLRADWAKGLSVATISQRLGTTRSAVTSKIRRLELNKRSFLPAPPPHPTHAQTLARNQGRRPIGTEGTT
jgi:hypothetical protein